MRSSLPSLVSSDSSGWFSASHGVPQPPSAAIVWGINKCGYLSYLLLPSSDFTPASYDLGALEFPLLFLFQPSRIPSLMEPVL